MLPRSTKQPTLKKERTHRHRLGIILLLVLLLTLLQLLLLLLLSGVHVLLTVVLVYGDLDELLVVDALAIHIIVKGLEALDLINLSQVHVVLNHLIARFYNKFPAEEIIDLLGYCISIPRLFEFRCHT